MTALQWWGIAIIAWIVGANGLGAIKAIREKRFGPQYITPKDVLSGIVGLIMMLVFFYGWFKYPDAPIHECASPTGFCGKQGPPHSKEEHHAFEVWQTSLFVIWPAGMAILFGLNRKRSNLDSVRPN